MSSSSFILLLFAYIKRQFTVTVLTYQHIITKWVVLEHLVEVHVDWEEHANFTLVKAEIRIKAKSLEQ